MSFKVTAAESRKISKPRTVLEKYHKLTLINADLIKLTEAFDLEIEL